MESCNSVEKEVDKAASKLTSLSQNASRNIAECQFIIAGLQDRGSTSQSNSILEDLKELKRIRKLVESVSTEHKDIHAPISRVGKAIDRNFVSPENPIGGQDMGPEKSRLLNAVVCDHLLKTGQWETAKVLIQEADLPISQQKLESFKKVGEIVESLKAREIQPALKFVEEYKTELEQVDSNLDFLLNKLQFVTLLGQGKKMEALSFANNLSRFIPHYKDEVQKLMGALLYSGSDHAVMYSDILNENIWDKIIRSFTVDLCSLLGFTASQKSHLSTCIDAGCQVLPNLVAIRQRMSQSKVSTFWSSQDELPVEVDLKICRYHSLLACPILRQVTTDANPPMRLFCGHVISQDALKQLSGSSKMKCPYCLVEQNPRDARPIFF